MGNILKTMTSLAGCILLLWVVGVVRGETVPSADDLASGLMPSKAAEEGRIQTMGPSPEPRPENPVIHLQIPFELNQYLISPRAMPYLQALGEALSKAELRGYIFEIQGHTCSLGSDKVNDWLSQMRAESVMEYLTSYFGLSPKQLHAVGYGKRKPLPDGDNAPEEGRIKNRRVSVVNTLRSFNEASNLPFLKTEIKYLRGKEVNDLLPGTTLTSRDNYYISFIPDRRCYVYFFQVDPRGEVTKLFPNPKFSEKSNPVSAAEFYRVPSRITDWIFLDENRGEEEIIILASPEALDEPEKVCLMILEEQGSPQVASRSKKEPIATMGAKGIRQAQVMTRPGYKEINMDSLFTWRLRFIHQ